MRLRNNIGLIGDFLGTIPVMTDLARQYGKLEVIPHPEALWIYPYIDCDDISIAAPGAVADLELDLSAAFRIAGNDHLYMSQAHYPLVGLPVPVRPGKAHLRIPALTGADPDIDYAVAPFSRSLPDEQKWPLHAWRELFAANPGLKFGVLANTRYDSADELSASGNIKILADLSFDYMMHTLLAARKGLISVVTGPSHLSYHLSVRNILLVNQGSWGKNPEALCIEKYIPDIRPEDIQYLM